MTVIVGYVIYYGIKYVKGQTPYFPTLRNKRTDNNTNNNITIDSPVAFPVQQQNSPTANVDRDETAKAEDEMSQGSLSEDDIDYETHLRNITWKWIDTYIKALMCNTERTIAIK